jgi:GH35 family endo-1,4-beta-xylanase
MFGKRRKRLAMAVPIAVLLAGGSVVPVGAEEQSEGGGVRSDFPIYGEDKFLGSVNQFNNPMFTQLFNQVAPENAGKWGVAAGTTQTAPMRWGQLDNIYNFAQQNDLPFRFHALVWGNQQPTWMRFLEPEEQLVELDKWFAAVAERYPDIEWLEVVNEPTWDPPDCDDPKNEGNLCNDAGDYLRALGGYNDTDGTGWDWILNSFRLARHHFPDTKLMINDVLITNSDEATTEYLEIIEVLQAEDLIDGIGVQGHVHVFKEGVPGPTVWRRDWAAEEDMSVHKANLDRLAATGLPIQVTELDLDGMEEDGIPGDEVQLADYRRVFPTLWEHPGVEGITLWGWRQPSHWRNAQNAPIVLSNDEFKPAAHWLFNYINGIAPVIAPDQGFTLGDGVANHVGTVEADDWASEIGRTHLRTFTWEIAGGTGAGAFTIEPSSGELHVVPSELDPKASEHSLVVTVNDGFHTSDEVEVTVVVPPVIRICHRGVKEMEIDREGLHGHGQKPGTTIGACPA